MRPPVSSPPAQRQGRYLNATLAAWLGRDVAQSQGGSLTLAEVLGDSGARMLSGITARPGGTVTETFDLDLRTATAMPSPSTSCIVSTSMPRAARAALALAGAAAQSRDVARGLGRHFGAAAVALHQQCADRHAEIDKQGVLRMANAAFLALSDKAKRGTDLRSIVAADDRAAVERALAAALAGEASLHVADVVIADERQRAVQLTFTRLGEGDATAVVFALDRTESKALEAQLAQGRRCRRSASWPPASRMTSTTC